MGSGWFTMFSTRVLNRRRIMSKLKFFRRLRLGLWQVKNGVRVNVRSDIRKKIAFVGVILMEERAKTLEFSWFFG